MRRTVGRVDELWQNEKQILEAASGWQSDRRNKTEKARAKNQGRTNKKSVLRSPLSIVIHFPAKCSFARD